MTDPINERDLFGNEIEPMTLTEWAMAFGLIAVLVAAIAATVSYLIG